MKVFFRWCSYNWKWLLAFFEKSFFYVISPIRASSFTFGILFFFSLDFSSLTTVEIFFMALPFHIEIWLSKNYYLLRLLVIVWVSAKTLIIFFCFEASKIFVLNSLLITLLLLNIICRFKLLFSNLNYVIHLTCFLGAT